MAEPTVYQYQLRTPKGRWLAYVVMRSDGYFSAVSNCGGYAYRWGSPGMEFRAFVAGLDEDADYLCCKLGRATWWDGAATLKGIREYILESRRKSGWTKEQAAQEWQTLADALSPYNDSSPSEHDEMDVHQFHEWYGETKIDDAHEFATYDYEPQLRAFAREVMPVLAKAIREQFKAEAAVADATASLAEWEHEGGSL